MIAKRLKYLRKKCGYLQKDIAKYLNMSQGGYSLYEKGVRTPDPETLHKIAKFYGVSVDYILGKSNNPNNTDNLEENQNVIKMILDDDIEVYFYDKTRVTPEKLEKMQQIYNLVFKDEKKK